MVSTRQSSIVASASTLDTVGGGIPLENSHNSSGTSHSHQQHGKLLRSGFSAPCSPPTASSSQTTTTVATWNPNNRSAMTLLKLPPEILEKIFSYLGYKQVAHLRQVCRTLDKVCQQILNSSFQRLQNQMLLRFHAIKAKMPRRESARRNHPLACESDIIETLHMRLTLLQMTFGKHIERKHCCFFAGEILDEVNRILHYIKVTNKLARPYKVTDELFDLTTMAMEFFKEHIEPTLPEIAYFGSDFIEFTFSNNSGTGKYFSLDSPPHGCGKGYESPTSGNEASTGHEPQPAVQSNLVLRKRIRKIKQGMKRYGTQLSMLRRDLRASKNKIADQQKQLIEYSSRMDEYDKKHEEMVRKFSTLLQELNKCKTELQYWRSRTPAMPLLCDAPTPTPSEDAHSTPEVFSIGLNVELTNPLEAIEFPTEVTSNNNDDLWKLYETNSEENKVKGLIKPTVSKVTSPKPGDSGSSSCTAGSSFGTSHQPLQLAIKPATPLSGKPKNMKRRATDEDLHIIHPVKKSKRNLKVRGKRSKF